jgi:hypothetical protein
LKVAEFVNGERPFGNMDDYARQSPAAAQLRPEPLVESRAVGYVSSRNNHRVPTCQVYTTLTLTLTLISVNACAGQPPHVLYLGRQRCAGLTPSRGGSSEF